MRYNIIRKLDISNGEGIGIALFCQGCDFHCKNCFNKITWDFNGGQEWTEEVEEQFLNLANKDYISRVSILGGEPLHDKNVAAILSLCKKIKNKFPNKKIWLYSGFTIEEILNSLNKDRKDILSYIDVLVDGKYEEDKKDIKYKWAGSTNQRIINAIDFSSYIDNFKKI